MQDPASRPDHAREAAQTHSPAAPGAALQTSRGERRASARHWLVDDEAPASPISDFAGGIAAEEVKQQPVDYAHRLQQAKGWVRQQEK